MGKWRQGVSAAAFAATLLAYANGSAWVWATRRAAAAAADGPGLQRVPGLNLAHLAMLALSLVWATLEGRTPRELGLGARGAGRSLGFGFLVGAIGSLIIRLFFAFPVLMKGAVRQPEYQGLSSRQLVWLLSGPFLLGSAVFEEIAFRGVLHAQLVSPLGVGRALVVGSAVFAGWHGVITWYNLRRSNLPAVLFPLLYAGAMVVLFAAGLLLAALRQATGHVAGSILAHWLMVASIVLAVARTRPSIAERGVGNAE